MEEEEVGEVPAQPTSSRRPSKTTRTFVVWQAYEIIKVIEDEKEVENAKCKYCGKIYVVESTWGTNHLLRHRKEM